MWIPPTGHPERSPRAISQTIIFASNIRAMYGDESGRSASDPSGAPLVDEMNKMANAAARIALADGLIDVAQYNAVAQGSLDDADDVTEFLCQMGCRCDNCRAVEENWRQFAVDGATPW